MRTSKRRLQTFKKSAKQPPGSENSKRRSATAIIAPDLRSADSPNQRIPAKRGGARENAGRKRRSSKHDGSFSKAELVWIEDVVKASPIADKLGARALAEQAATLRAAMTSIRALAHDNALSQNDHIALASSSRSLLKILEALKLTTPKVIDPLAEFRRSLLEDDPPPAASPPPAKKRTLGEELDEQLGLERGS